MTADPITSRNIGQALFLSLILAFAIWRSVKAWRADPRKTLLDEINGD